MTPVQKLKKRFPGLRKNEPLKNHCSFRVGGPADFFYELKNIEELPELITLAEENFIPYKIIGRGTNIVFTDKGFRGLIIKNLTAKFNVADKEIIADSGLPVSQIIKISIDHSLTGLEPLYGIPGSIGGAVWGNAGVPGVEIGSFVNNLTLFNVSDGIHNIKKENLEFKYRWSSLQKTNEHILRVTLRLEKGDNKQSKELIKQKDEIRRNKQPYGYTAGSFFKNPSKEKSAGFLIEQAGLKGHSIGEAQISPKHANFFMNNGHALAADILKLAKLATQAVKKKFGIELEMEVKIIGDL